MLIPAERRNKIYEILRANGTVRVSSLSEAMEVSEITIRRDLELMEEEGQLERTHGGAILSQHIHLEPQYSEKHRSQQVEKQTIGQAAARLVEENDTLLINSGSTTLQIFRHLNFIRNVRVITSNIGAFLEAQGSPIELLMVGGTYRPQSNSLVGPLAILSLQQVYASKCFIGVDGISIKYGVTTPNIQEAEIARTMIERTRGQVVVLADHTKFGVVADFISASLEKIHTIITDENIHPEYVENLEANGVRVIVASRGT